VRQLSVLNLAWRSSRSASSGGRSPWLDALAGAAPLDASPTGTCAAGGSGVALAAQAVKKRAPTPSNDIHIPFLILCMTFKLRVRRRTGAL